MAKRTAERANWPTGLYQIRGDYFIYRSPVSGRSMSLGKVPLAEAIAYAKWANEQAGDAKFEDKVGRVANPHAHIDGRGLLEPSFIAAKAMSFDRIAGIYFLLRDDQIVYVGRSTNIMVRLSNHRFEATKEFNRVFVVECPVANMDRMERMYIDKFKPIYNESCPPVEAGAPVWSENIRALLGAAIHQAK
jgi:hypothetical protein